MDTHPLPHDRKEYVTGVDLDKGVTVNLRKTHPEQLTLWQTFLPDDTHRDDYSNTVDLYDAVPKYFASKKRMAEQRENGKFLTTLKHHFRHKGKDYTVMITPARIQEKDGSEREYYPSWREELVEEALKKLACDQLHGLYLDNNAGVQFTLYALRKELKSRGHEMRWNDLIQSLLICRRATIVITARNDDGSEIFLDSSIFPTLLIAKRRDWEKNPKGSRCYVQFNPLVTQSINRLAYRQFDYATFMTLQRQLARWFCKRLSHNYLQASLMAPYQIKLTTIVRDSAMVNAQRTRDKVRYVDESLDELKEKAVLMDYGKHVVTGNRHAIEDVTYTLIPHPGFVAQMKKANKRHSTLAVTAPPSSHSMTPYERLPVH